MAETVNAGFLRATAAAAASVERKATGIAAGGRWGGCGGGGGGNEGGGDGDGNGSMSSASRRPPPPAPGLEVIVLAVCEDLRKRVAAALQQREAKATLGDDDDDVGSVAVATTANPMRSEARFADGDVDALEVRVFIDRRAAHHTQTMTPPPPSHHETDDGETKLMRTWRLETPSATIRFEGHVSAVMDPSLAAVDVQAHQELAIVRVADGVRVVLCRRLTAATAATLCIGLTSPSLKADRVVHVKTLRAADDDVVVVLRTTCPLDAAESGVVEACRQWIAVLPFTATLDEAATRRAVGELQTAAAAST